MSEQKLDIDNIEFRINEPISDESFVDLLQRSSLAQRRPVDDCDCVHGMLQNANLLVTAWIDNELVGVSRSVTDFHYCCYLSDLAVDLQFQKQGIGRALIQRTQSQLGPKCNLILIAAPAAKDYYQHIGFEHQPQCWILPAGSR